MRPPDLSGESERLPCSSAEDRYERLFVYGIWTVMALVAIVFVLRYGSTIPVGGEWNHVCFVTDSNASTLKRLWHAGERSKVPLSDLLMWATLEFANGDLRVGMLLGVLPLAAVALALCLTAGRIRGSTEYTDAFFPLVLLNLGHAPDFLRSIQSYSIWACCLLCMLFASFVNPNWYRSRSTLVGLGLCLILLPLQGAVGLSTVPALILCFTVLLARQLRQGMPDAKRSAALMGAFAIGAAVVLAMRSWVLGYFTLGGSPMKVFSAAIECLALGLGPGAHRLWPLSGLAILALLLLALIVLGYGYLFTRQQDRLHILLMVLAIGAPVSSALSIHWRRSAGSADSLLGVPLMCLLYLIWVVFAPRRFGRFMQVVMFTAICGLWVYNSKTGLDFAQARSAHTRAFIQDVEAGIPATGIVGRHACYWALSKEQTMAAGMQALQRMRVGVFSTIASEAPMRRHRLSPEPAAASQMSRQGNTWCGTSRQSQLFFELKEPRRVYAIQLSYRAEVDNGYMRMHVKWRGPGEDNGWPNIHEGKFLVNLQTGRPERTQTVWVNQAISQIAISPDDRPFRFQLTDIALLGPLKSKVDSSP